MANFTRKAIMDACLKLLEKKPISKITVRDIVEECGISRNSFYYHFEDIPALINAIVVETADSIIEAHADSSSLLECLQIAADFAQKNKKAMLNIYKHADRELYEMHLFGALRHIIQSYSRKVVGEVPLSKEDREIVERFLSSILFGQMIDWLNHDMDYDLIAQFRRYYELRQGEIGKMIEQSILL